MLDERALCQSVHKAHRAHREDKSTERRQNAQGVQNRYETLVESKYGISDQLSQPRSIKWSKTLF